MTDQPLADLEGQRARLFEQLAGLGDFPAGQRQCHLPALREGELRLRSGKPPRARAALPVDPLGGREDRSRQLSGAELEKVRREVANYKEFLAVSEQIVEVSEAICEVGLSAAAAGEPRESQPGKGGSARRSWRRPPPR